MGDPYRLGTRRAVGIGGTSGGAPSTIEEVAHALFQVTEGHTGADRQVLRKPIGGPA